MHFLTVDNVPVRFFISLLFLKFISQVFLGLFVSIFYLLFSSGANYCRKKCALRQAERIDHIAWKKQARNWMICYIKKFNIHALHFTKPTYFYASNLNFCHPIVYNAQCQLSFIYSLWLLFLWSISLASSYGDLPSVAHTSRLPLSRVIYYTFSRLLIKCADKLATCTVPRRLTEL